MKNILLISPFFYPEPISTGKYNTDLVKELAREGHKITVVCSHPIYPDWQVNDSNKTLDGIEIIRGGLHIKYPKNNLARRFLLELWFAFFILRKAIKFRKKIDIIIPVFPPSLAFSFIVKLFPLEVKKVGIVHDLQSVFISKEQSLFKSCIAFCIKSVETFGFNSCDKLILLSNEMQNNVNNTYEIDAKKLFVQYPFANLPSLVTNDLDNVFNKNYKHVVYSGALGEKQNPIGLLSFFEFSSNKIKNVKFHIFSSGIIFNDLKKRNSNEDIYFHELVPFKNLRELYERSDVQIIPQGAGTSGGSLPSKLPNLVDSNCKILLITDKDSEIQQLFESYNLGGVINEWNNKLLLIMLENLLFEVKENEIIKSNFARELFSIKSLVKEII
jgi:colanic acid biosynthesis glycosyl transferase WcaI